MRNGGSLMVPTTKRRTKRRHLALVQLFIIIVIIALMWVSFGQNVLTTQNQVQSDIPERLGELELVSSVEGTEALAQINRLHGTDIELTSAYIAEYAGSGEHASVWVGRTESEQNGAELIDRMSQAIATGNSVFNNLQRLTVNTQTVFQISGPGGEHFFFNSGKRGQEVVWLSIESTDAFTILEEALNTF